MDFIENSIYKEVALHVGRHVVVGARRATPKMCCLRMCIGIGTILLRHLVREKNHFSKWHHIKVAGAVFCQLIMLSEQSGDSDENSECLDT